MCLLSHINVYILTRHIVLLNTIYMTFERNWVQVICLSVWRSFLVTLESMVLIKHAITKCKIHVYYFETVNANPVILNHWRSRTFYLYRLKANFTFPERKKKESSCFQFCNEQALKKEPPENPEMLIRIAFFSSSFPASCEHAEHKLINWLLFLHKIAGKLSWHLQTILFSS